VVSNPQRGAAVLPQGPATGSATSIEPGLIAYSGLSSRLLTAAADKPTAGFRFIDILEAPDHRERLQVWLGAQLPDYRLNETTHVPLPHRKPLHCELSAMTYNLLRERSRLDSILWTKIGRLYMLGSELVSMRETTLLRGIARYAALMAA
jgi:hypothetical protein